MTFTKFIAAAGLAVTLAGPVAAAGNLTQLQASVSKVLPVYGYSEQDVKVILNWNGQERQHSINKSD